MSAAEKSAARVIVECSVLSMRKSARYKKQCESRAKTSPREMRKKLEEVLKERKCSGKVELESGEAYSHVDVSIRRRTYTLEGIGKQKD